MRLLKILIIALLPLQAFAQYKDMEQYPMAGIPAPAKDSEMYIYNPSQDPKSVERSLQTEKNSTLFTQGWTSQACYPKTCPLRSDIYAAAIDDFKAHYALAPTAQVVVDSWVCGRLPQDDYRKSPCDPIDGLAIAKICLKGETNFYCNPTWHANVFYLGATPFSEVLNSNLAQVNAKNCDFSGMITDRVFLEQYMNDGVCYITYRDVVTNFKVVDIGGLRLDLSDRSIILNGNPNPFVIKELEHNTDKVCTFEPPNKDLYLEHIWSRDIHSYVLDLEYLQFNGFPRCP